MMSLDEFIRYLECNNEQGCYVNEYEINQLAEWLRELKAYKKAKDEIIRRIEEAKNKDKIAEYHYIRCINIVKEVCDENSSY